MQRWPMWWGLFGTLALLLDAVVRLSAVAWSTWPGFEASAPLLAVAIWIPIIVYGEGHRAFHRRFCPLTVARARTLDASSPWLHKIGAPLFAMGLIHATRRRLVTSWAVVIGVVTMVLLIRQLPPVWRGVVDLGVAAALGYGCVSLLWHAFVNTRISRIDPELPGPAAPAKWHASIAPGVEVVS